MNKNKNEFKLLVRRFVLATSFPPFLQIYRAIYALVIRVTLGVFKKYPQIKAVYLRRGGAKGEVLPLVSDIDFAVIGERLNEEDERELHQEYNRLVQVTTLLDRTLEFYDEDTFYNQYQTNDYFQYRFMEGKKTWKLLYGKDYLADLAELPIEKMYGGFFTEIKVWWSLFAWRFFQARKYNDEAVTRNNACYKTVSEILKMNLALNHGILEFDRKKALELSKPQFKGKELAFLRKLEKKARVRFRSDEPGILDETNDFLISYLDRFYRDSRNHPYARPLRDATQRVDCMEGEMILNGEEDTHIGNLVRFVKENWPDSYFGAYLASSAYFNIDELLLMVRINPERVPTVREITAFNQFHWSTGPHLRSRIRLFLLLPNAAFQVDPDDLSRSWQSILTPSSNPDLFELLSRPEFTVDGGNCQPNTSFAWNPFVEHFFWEEKMLFYQLLQNPSVYKLNNLDFLRIFWKTAQLVVMNRSVNRNEIVYPLTLPAIERSLAEEGIPLPGELNGLAGAYRDEIKGKDTDIAGLIPRAILYLKEINS
jgi:predicted nucleotidyltransferase